MALSFRKANINVRLVDRDEFDPRVQYSPEDISVYLNLAFEGFLENNDQHLLFRCIMKAIKWMGISKVARQAKMTKQGISTAFGRSNANPSFATLVAVLKVLGGLKQMKRV